MGTVYFTKAVIDQMIENGYGRIINVASVAGVYGLLKSTPYSATKGAALAKEVATNGITLNAVSPGSVSPSDNRDIDFHKPSDLSFMGRTGTNRENADLIRFLASDKAAYISGQNIQIDGCRKVRARPATLLPDRDDPYSCRSKFSPARRAVVFRRRGGRAENA